MGISKSFPLTFKIEDFSLGWDNINKPTTLDKRTFVDIKNFNLTPRRGLEKRKGLSELYPAAACDHVIDGAFENWESATDLTSWTESTTGSSTVNREASEQYAGTYCTRIDADGSRSYAAVSQTITLVDDDKYEFSFWYKSSVGSGDLLHVTFSASDDGYWMGSSGGWSGPAVGAGSFVLTATTTWSKFTASFTASHGTGHSLAISSCTHSSGILSESIYIDNVSITADGDITDLYEYKAPDGNNYILTRQGTVVRAYYNSKWNTLITGRTEGERTSFETHRGLCYGANGVDNNWKLYNTTQYDVGITPPDGAPDVVEASTGSSIIAAEYETSNLDHCGELRATAAQTKIVQTFKTTSSYEASSVVLWLKKTESSPGTLTGNMTAQIFSDEGVTQVGGDSDVLDVSTLTTAYAAKTFTFSGTAPSLTLNRTYYIILTSTHAVSTTNFVDIGFDNSSTAFSDGAYYEVDGSDVFTQYDSIDLVFRVNGIGTGTSEQLSFGALETGSVDFLRYANAKYLVAQSFRLDNDSDVASVKIPLRYLYDSGDLATKYLWAEIHDDTAATSETKGASTNMVPNGETAFRYIGITLTSDFAWVEFTFGTAPSLTANTDYYLVLYCNYSIAADDAIEVSVDSSGYANGARQWIDDVLAWTAKTNDYSFKILGAETSGALKDEYSYTNQDVHRGLLETTSQTKIVQSFKSTEAGTLSSIKLHLCKVGSPTGNMTVEVHSTKSGDKVDDTSDTSAVAALGSFPTYGQVTFSWSGTAPTINADQTYYIVLTSTHSASTSDYVMVGQDKIAPDYADGTRFDIDGSDAWTEYDGTDLIFEVNIGTSGIGGTYYYIYTYKRTSWHPAESNPSDTSDVMTPDGGQKVSIDVVASSDSQVDKIIIYRTQDGDTSPFYMLVELPNSTATYHDEKSDSALSYLYEFNNTLPSKATFLKLHQDRMFYANLPDEEAGGSLVMWSKSGNGDSVPSTNYQYFDKDDGEDITGVASLGTFFFVFKPNKIGVLNILAPELWYLAYGIGCVAPWAIQTYKDKVVFLSEEGWKATDGTDIWDLSSNINGLIEDGYISTELKKSYSVAYYPEKEHFEFLINHPTETPKVIVGHFLVPLILKPTGISELVKQNIMGWTYHEYDYHTLTCVSNYTDDDGITRVIAGAANGFVYLLDSGTDDDGNNITAKLRTDWLSLGTPRSVTKVVRKGYLAYGTSGTISLDLTVDIDFAATGEVSTFTGGDVDLDDSISESFNMTGTGELFRFTLAETSSESLDIMGLVMQFRSKGIR